MTFRILTFDGGGIRGVMSAAMLKAVEKQIDQPLNEYFDLIAGTSTGSILAASVAMGLKADEIMQLYQHKGITIFPYTSLFSVKRLKLILKYGISAPKYSEDGLIKVLQDQFGNRRLSEIESTKLLLISYDTQARNPIIFKSWREDKPWINVPLWEACLCSASAPTYFPAHLLQCLVDGTSQGATDNTITLDKNAAQSNDDYLKGQIYISDGLGSGQTRTITNYDAATRVAKVDSTWNTIPDNTSAYRIMVEYSAIDGGVGANNPAACALAEAIRLRREPLKEVEVNKLPDQTNVGDLIEDISILSIGTGSANRPIPWKQDRGWGLLQWAWNGRLIDVVFDAPSDIHDYITRQVMSVPGVTDNDSPSYLRLQPEIVNDYIDDATPENIARLIRSGEDYIQTKQNSLTNFFKGI